MSGEMFRVWRGTHNPLAAFLSETSSKEWIYFRFLGFSKYDKVMGANLATGEVSGYESCDVTFVFDQLADNIGRPDLSDADQAWRDIFKQRIEWLELTRPKA